MNFILNIIKFILFIFLIPILVTLSVAFAQGIWSLPNRFGVNFIWGAGSFLVLHLFIIEIKGAFDFGKKLMSDLFKFAGPASEAFGYVIPIFSLLLMLFFYITGLVFGAERPDRYFIFFIGFMFMMHLISAASTLREASAAGGIASYYFYMTLVYIVNLMLIAFGFSLLFPDFSFVKLFESVVADAGHVYQTVFRQLFLR